MPLCTSQHPIVVFQLLRSRHHHPHNRAGSPFFRNSTCKCARIEAPTSSSQKYRLAASPGPVLLGGNYPNAFTSRKAILNPAIDNRWYGLLKKGTSYSFQRQAFLKHLALLSLRFYPSWPAMK